MTRLRVGQRVRARRQIWYPGLGVIAETGAVGTIIGAGVDAAFGTVQVAWPRRPEGEAIPTTVGPVYRVDPMAELEPER